MFCAELHHVIWTAFASASDQLSPGTCSLSSVFIAMLSKWQSCQHVVSCPFLAAVRLVLRLQRQHIRFPRERSRTSQTCTIWPAALISIFAGEESEATARLPHSFLHPLCRSLHPQLRIWSKWILKYDLRGLVWCLKISVHGNHFNRDSDCKHKVKFLNTMS